MADMNTKVNIRALITKRHFLNVLPFVTFMNFLLLPEYEVGSDLFRDYLKEKERKVNSVIIYKWDF